MTFIVIFKRVTTALLLVSIFGMTYYVGFKKGQASSSSKAAGIIRSGGFVASYDALQSLRNGELTNGITRLEDFCYSTAVSLLDSSSPQRTVVSQMFRDGLVEYRKLHSRPAGMQTPTERRLDALLAEATRQ